MTVYPPSEDSELLLEVALREVKSDDVVLEVGVGSGFVSERIKGRCKLLIATDINPFACRVSRLKGIDVIRTDLVKGLKRSFDLILFNPPYLELGEDEKVKKEDWLEKSIDGGKGGIEVICRFLDTIKDVLNEGGRIILIVSSLNKDVFKEIERRSFNWEIVGKRKLFFEEIYALKLTL